MLTDLQQLTMVISTTKIVTEPSDKEKILEILFSVKGPTEGKPGCIRCSIYLDLQNEHVIVYEEVWRSKEDLFYHIRSDLYRSILAVMDMSSEPPGVAFSTISSTTGMELIKSALGYFDMEVNNQRRIEANRRTK